jgi:hypothetical protein
MFTTSQVTRTVATVALMATLGTTSAVARPSDDEMQRDAPIVHSKADVPTVQHDPPIVRYTPSAGSPSQRFTAPRTDSMGVRPVPSAPVTAVSLTRESSDSDWLPIAGVIGAAVLLLLLLLTVAAMRSDRSMAHPFRTPRA